MPSIERASFADETFTAKPQAGISSEAAKNSFYTRGVQHFLAVGIGNNMFKLNEL